MVEIVNITLEVASLWIINSNTLNIDDCPSFQDLVCELWHNPYGPAVTWANGVIEWWWYDMHLSLEDWLKANDVLSDEEKLMMKLQYS